MVIIGGHITQREDNFERMDDIWSYDPSSNKFEEIVPIGQKPPKLSRHRVVVVDNLLYSFGGIIQDRTKLNSIFTFDLNTRIWTDLNSVCELKGTPPSPRCDPVVVAYGKQIVVFGGSDKDMCFLSDIHVFDTVTNTWSQPTTQGEAPPSRIGAVGTVVRNKMFLYGGGSYDKIVKAYTRTFPEIWTLNLDTWTWELEQFSGVPPSVCDFLSVFNLGNHLFIDGGWYTKPWCYDTVAHSWCAVENAPLQNNNDSSCALLGQTAVYYGGFFNYYRHHLSTIDLTDLSFLFPVGAN
jgi:N-acetylneuraminic acid mutarotase